MCWSVDKDSFYLGNRKRYGQINLVSCWEETYVPTGNNDRILGVIFLPTPAVVNRHLAYQPISLKFKYLTPLTIISHGAVVERQHIVRLTVLYCCKFHIVIGCNVLKRMTKRMLNELSSGLTRHDSTRKTCDSRLDSGLGSRDSRLDSRLGPSDSPTALVT